MKVSGTFKAWAIVVVLMFSSIAGIHSVQAHQAEKLARECGSLPAVKEHFIAILEDGETQSDWLTHLPPKCRRTMYFAGLQLNDALNQLEVPYLREP